MPFCRFAVAMDDMESYLVMLFESRYQPTFAERYPIPLLAAVLDFLLVIAAVYLAYWLRFDTVDLNARYTTAAFTISSVVMLSLWGSGVYGSWRGISLARQIGNVLFGWVVAVAILLAIIFFLKVSDSYSRRWFVYVLFLGGGLSVSLRLMVYWLLRLLRSGGRNLKNVLVVDAGGISVERLNSGRSLREFGFRVAEMLSFSRDSEWLKALEMRVAILVRLRSGSRVLS